MHLGLMQTGLSLTVIFLTTSSQTTIPFSIGGDVYSVSTPSKGENTKVIESFHMKSDIRYRLATTEISSLVRNTGSTSQEIGFDVTLPKEAFIVAFHMTIDGQRYDGRVKERQQAKEEYQAAVDRGESAGHVRQAPRHADVFEIFVNVEAGSAVNFSLTYQEILRRRFGVYEHEIHVSPGQPVEDLRVEVRILENRPLRFVRTPELRTGNLLTSGAMEEGEKAVEYVNDLTVVERPTPETAKVVYAPSLTQQNEASVGGKRGITARFAIQYDVEHGGPGGDVLVVDGYFVHFMVPSDETLPLPKDIIFALDVSGSMGGNKIHQLKDAMETILSDLMPKDRFNIITYSSVNTKWKEGLVIANEDVVFEAKSYIKKISAGGSTNSNGALLEALSDLRGRQSKERVGMIFFLTDGHPTAGVTHPEEIARNVLNANEGAAALFSLAFGTGADYDSLKSLSLQNSGFARKIYEASDAALQVASLYDEISAVAVKDMRIMYQQSSVDEFSLTETEFPIVFKGSEIMVCGLLENNTESLEYEIKGVESTGDVDIVIAVSTLDSLVTTSFNETEDQFFSGPRDFSGMVEKMWAYLTIKQLLRQRDQHADDEEKVSKLEQRALDMSLKYKFVTPLTSMVVTRPDQRETEMRDSPQENMSSDMRSAGGTGFSINSKKGHRPTLQSDPTNSNNPPNNVRVIAANATLIILMVLVNIL